MDQNGMQTHSLSCLPLSHTAWRAHSLTNLPFLHTEVVEGTLTHSLTHFPPTRGSGRSDWRSHSLQLLVTHRFEGTLTL